MAFRNVVSACMIDTKAAGWTDLSRLFTLPCDNQSGLSTSNWSVQSIGCVSYELLDISISGKLKIVKGKFSLIF